MRGLEDFRFGIDSTDKSRGGYHQEILGQKKPKWTRLLIIDSQAVKNTCTASVNSKEFCHYKCTNGIKRHLAVDTQGLPFFTYCTPANISEDLSLIELLRIAN
jgi:hypothetical protein